MGSIIKVKSGVAQTAQQGNILVQSSNIDVYPCTNRSFSGDVNSRYHTEYNLVSIVNRLVDRKSFCVSTSVVSSDFTFNIGGYLFTLDSEGVAAVKGICSEQYPYVYACICVGTRGNYQELLPLDNDVMDSVVEGTSQFYGITFVAHNALISPGSKGSGWEKGGDGTGDVFDEFGVASGASSTFKKYILPIMYKVDGASYIVPPDSIIKFVTSTDGSSHSVTIDDGELG